MNKNLMKYLFTLAAILVLSQACKEGERYMIDSNDTVPPNEPTNITYTPLYGGARFHYTLPKDEDLLSIDAVYTNAKGEEFWFSASYYSDSLDVYGFGDTLSHEVKLYAVDRAGNKSTAVVKAVIPLEPAVSRVAKSIVVKPGFNSFFLDWVNELEKSINIYVDFDFVQNGVKKEYTSVFSSNFLTDRKFIEDIPLTPADPINVKVRVEDRYGNTTVAPTSWQIFLYEDKVLPKASWYLPPTNDSIAGVPQFYGDGYEGRTRYLIDDIIDMHDNRNFIHTAGRGRTGNSSAGNLPWNIIIDLGGYYELSRIVTNQRHDRANDVEQGQFFHGENVGLYRMYILDEERMIWDTIATTKIPVPVGKSQIEIVKLARAGDMAYMYPDDPKYTRPARWFRYEALKCFDDNYNSNNANCLSEITLYGKKAQ